MSHPDSVISAQILEYHADFYNKLCDQEEYCYTQSTQEHGSLTTYSPFFQDLNAALVATFTGAYTQAIFKELMDSIYSSKILNKQFDLWPTLDDDIYVYDIFNMGGLLQTVLDAAVSYFDDIYQVTDPDTLATYYVAPNLESATEQVSDNAVENANTEAQAVVDLLMGRTQKQVNKMMFHEVYRKEEVDAPGFEDPGVPYIVQVGTPPPKKEMYDIVFVETKYDPVLGIFNITGVNPFE